MSAESRWHGVELRHLAALEAVGRERSFSAAAVSLGYTQSAISGQIGALERIVGARLVERIRGSRLVDLTAEGEIVVAHAAAIAGRLEAAQSDLALLRGGAAPALRIGTFRTLSRTLVAEALRGESDDHEISLHDCTSAQILDRLERRRLDIAFTLLPAPDGPLVTAELYRDEQVLLVRRDDPLAVQPRASLEGRRLIAAGPVPAGTNAMHVEDPASLVALVSAGVGVGIAPAQSVVLPQNVTAVRFGDGPPALVVALVWHAERPLGSRARRFVQLATNAAATLGERPLLRAL